MKSSEVSASERWKHILDETIYWSLLVLVFFIPLLIHPFIYDAFELPKVTFLRLMSIFLLILWVARVLLYSETVIKRTRLDKYLVLFLVVIGLSTILSVHPLTSLLGSYFRYEGLLTFFSYALLFFLGIQVFSGGRLRTLAMVVVCSASLAALYGIAQYFGYNFFAWPEIETHRSVSTFGNSVLFGAFLALVFPISFCIFLESSERKEELLSGVGLFLIFLALVTTFSRGTWLATLAGIIFLVFILWGKGVSKRKLGTTALIITLVITSVELLSFTAVPSYELGYRAVSSANLQQSSVKQRLFIWKGVLGGIKERPFLGYGLDSFAVVFHRFQTPEYVRAFFRVDRPFARVDNAHNYLIQLSATAGIPAALLATLFLFLFFINALKGTHENKDSRILKSGFLAGTVSYTAALFFGIGAVGVAALFWLFLGSLMSESSWKLSIKWKRRSYVLRIALFLLIITAGATLLFFSLRLLRADAYFARARSFANRGAFPQAAREYEIAVKLNPWEGWYGNGQGLNYFNWAEADQSNSGRLLEMAASYVEKAKNTSPVMFDNYLVLGNVYRFSGMGFDEKCYLLAEKNLREAIRLSPNSPDVHYLLGFIYLLEGKENMANYELFKAKSLCSSYEPLYYSLGEYFENRGEIGRAKEMYLRALKQEPKRAREALERLGE